MPNQPHTSHSKRVLRVPCFDFDVPVVIDPECEHRGVVRVGFDRPVVYLREWNERVLLHETMHVLLMSWWSRRRDGFERPAHEVEEEFVRHLTSLYEIGWRLADA